MNAILKLPQRSSKQPNKNQSVNYDFAEEMELGIIEETPEMLQAIDEGLESLKKEKSVPIDVVRDQLKRKWATR